MPTNGFSASTFPSGRPSFSHSALEKYLQCSEYYRLYYLDTTVPRPEGRSLDMVVGSLVHSILEVYYAQGGKGQAKAFATRYWQKYFDALDLKNVFHLIQEYNTDFEVLRFRAHKDYAGEDAIRTKDGSVPKNPTMTDAWTQAAKEMNLDRRKEIIDRAVALKDSEFAAVSCVDVFREVFKVLDNYEHPEYIKTVDHLELSLAGVRYPTTGKAMTGFIDLVGRTEDDCLIIVDHKTTSRTHRDAFKAGFSEQLLLYGWAYYQKFKKIPEYLAINFIRSNTLVAAPFEMDRAQDSILRREQAIRAILTGLFIKNNPVNYGSPCWNEHSKTGCPYLWHCYPDFYGHVKNSAG